MGGIEFQEGELVVDRAPNTLDELAIRVSTILQELEIEHAFVAGYVAILTGRSRATEDIDAILEPIDVETTNRLVEQLEASGLWGPAMPLSEMYETLENGANIWIAQTDETVPHVEAKWASDAADRATLEESLTARVNDETIPIGPLELQIAYKLYLGTQTDFQDAVHLHTLFEETLRRGELERWVDRLAVHEEYERLLSA